MPRGDLEAAFDMEGACNDVSFTLMHGVNEDEVIRRIDNIIDTWGGVGSYGRSDQTSHRFISDEITQLKAMGLVTPVIFMSVAAFLLNIVMNRMIDTQREQIAALKAFGYYDAEVSLHYLTFVGIIVACGVLTGVLFGVWMGRGLTAMYTDFFHFPVFRFEFDWFTTLVTGGACAAAALLGTWRALRSASRLPPAEAMRPKSPGVFRPSLLERFGMQAFLPQTVRMILRHISRRPLKSAFSVVGISMAFGVVVLGNFGLDALTFIVDFQFRQVQRQDVQVSLAEAADDHVRHNFSSMTGVTDVEVFRSVPVRIRHGARSERTAVMGLEQDRRLFRVMAENGNEPFSQRRRAGCFEASGCEAADRSGR